MGEATGEWKAARTRRQECLHYVAQAFQPAGSGDILVPSYVHMPGGAIAIEIGEDFAIRMTGPVTKVSEGIIAEEMLVKNIPAGIFQCRGDIGD